MKLSDYVAMLILVWIIAISMVGCFVEGAKVYRTWAHNRAIERMWRNKRKQKPLCF